MIRRRDILLLAAAGIAASAATAALPPAERARIDRLILYVQTRKDVRFIRNNHDYSSEEAASFLRKKLDRMGEHVSSAREFIEQIASKSSTSGEAYAIRFANGRTESAAKFLGDELHRMDAGK